MYEKIGNLGKNTFQKLHNLDSSTEPFSWVKCGGQADWHWEPYAPVLAGPEDLNGIIYLSLIWSIVSDYLFTVSWII